MLKDRMAAAKEVAEKLMALEEAIDDAILCAAELTVATSNGRKRANISAVVGQAAMTKTADTYASLMNARAQMVDAHGAFADVKDEIGLRVLASGMYDQCVKGSASPANEDIAHEDEPTKIFG